MSTPVFGSLTSLKFLSDHKYLSQRAIKPVLS
jgi:hypothetical protein